MKRALTMSARLGVAAGMLAALTTGAISEPVSIYDIQTGTVLEGEPVTVEGVVVIGTYFNGFFAQETAPDATWGWQFSGIWCYTGGGPNVERGDLVTLNGRYEEFFDESEVDLTGGGTVEVTGTAPLPAPQNLLITDVNNGSPVQENWEGVYVEITLPNMVATDSLLSGCGSDPNDPTDYTRWGVYQTDAPGDSLFVRNSVVSHEKPPSSSPINFIRGSMSYHRCNRKILPRDNDDIGYVGPPNLVWAYSTGATTVDVEFSRNVTTASSENLGNYLFLSGLSITGATRDVDEHNVVHLTTNAQPNALDEIFVQNIQTEGGAVMPTPQSFQFRTNITPIADIQTVADPAIDDASPLVGQVVSILGVTTSSNNDTGTSDVYVADASGAWNALEITFTGDTFDIGDQCLASGQIQESFGNTVMGFAGFGRSVNLGPGTPVTPVSIPQESLPYAGIADSEQYESCLVSLSEAQTDSIPGDIVFGEWLLFQTTLAPGDSSKYDVSASGQDETMDYEPCVGDRIEITGNVRYSFGEYHVLPRIGDDINIIAEGPDCVVATGEVTVPISMTLSNHPNPFNPSTTIEFTVPAEGNVTVQIFDVSGSLVRMLVSNEVVQPGPFSVRWDGKDENGASVGSGTYFYRALLGDVSVTNRMTLLK